ncbi:tyrosine phosphatase family-domain-containing protein [Zychaea mexicana]|uniref:tyrosine phosphatase family-domain-containing protein n=1 Tax=Zychaea mexicana TaxID=64656 RepID=UPI0022FDC9CA|nr:tyrosine phosphatase family-domain-containing protein [Zychaea mexicana]KAI9495724.1 tyrosine phosphatase family-domain-containing protein [Zychaea mexicana]
MNEKQIENDGSTTTTVTTVTTVTQQQQQQQQTWLTLPPAPTIQSLGLSNWPFTRQDDQELFQEALIPPDNFNMVCEHVYRSSFPKKKHFRFLEKLKLKSVLTLILEDYPEQNMKFLEEQGIKFLQFGIAGNKEPFVQIPEDKISAALAAILDKRNHPMLVHCNKGKHRTGCLIGCLRKVQNWSHTSIFDEYRRFSHPKSRSMDQQFIELYDANQVWPLVDRRYLPRWPTLADPLL